MSQIEIYANGHKVSTLRLETAIGWPHLSGGHVDARFYGNEQFRLKPVGEMLGTQLLGPQPVSNGMTVKVRGASGLTLELRLETQVSAASSKPPQALLTAVEPHYKGLPQPPFDAGAEYYCGRCSAATCAPPGRSGWGFCPSCQALYFFLEESVSQKLQYPWQFLSRTEWPRARSSITARGSRERVEEIWMDVAKTVKYEKDDKRFNGRPDVWQTAAETLSFGVGDCEDHSILLADWLVSEGYEMRLAIGETRSNDEGWSGHVWVVLRSGGMEYLIEAAKKTTIQAFPGADPRRIEEMWRSFYRLETVDALTKNFRPFFVFDSQRIWTRRGYGVNQKGECAIPQPPSSYWAESEWIEGIWLRKR
jgi:predicted transglutaminase-like cysteine proteinase